VNKIPVTLPWMELVKRQVILANYEELKAFNTIKTPF
jgi:hypothetical protein